MLATLVRTLPEGSEWEYELKLVGYSLQRRQRTWLPDRKVLRILIHSTCLRPPPLAVPGH
jgi:hypothetical protein